MKALGRRFKNITDRNPFWSSPICFAEAIRDQKFGRQAIHRWFQKLVEKDDYSESDKKDILVHLAELSNMPEDDKK